VAVSGPVNHDINHGFCVCFCDSRYLVLGIEQAAPHDTGAVAAG
ncbi:uncharacterized protein METZ01_LOCUS110745, partial [marine metagenome]|jgi:hypothetical protein